MQQAPQPQTIDLSYDGLNRYFNNKTGFIESRGYMIMILPENKNFIAFFKQDLPEGACEEGKVFKAHGLKFHISLPEYNNVLFKKGWDIVRDTLIYHNVAGFKIIREGHKMSEVPGQEGKDVTVYVNFEPYRTVESLRTVIEDVTRNLVNGGVPPGYRSSGTQGEPEFPINGSNYVTYRYYNERTRKSIRPDPDPCQRIIIDVKNQPDIPKLQRQTQIVEREMKKTM